MKNNVVYCNTIVNINICGIHIYMKDKTTIRSLRLDSKLIKTAAKNNINLNRLVQELIRHYFTKEVCCPVCRQYIGN